MSSINGQLTTCDRCGETIFRKCTGEGETDGGYTRWNEFEPFPTGWSWIDGIGRVCPECGAEFASLIEVFLSKGRSKYE